MQNSTTNSSLYNNSHIFFEILLLYIDQMLTSVNFLTMYVYSYDCIIMGSSTFHKFLFIFFTIICFLPLSPVAFNIFSHSYDKLDQKYGSFTKEMRQEMMEEVQKMFYFGYDGYMKHAFPLDELDPINCVGRGPDYDNP